MNSLNNSGMISAIQKPDGSPYDDSATPTPPLKKNRSFQITNYYATAVPT